jgi:hypothetical protein
MYAHPAPQLSWVETEPNGGNMFHIDAHTLAAFQALYTTHMGQAGMVFSAASALVFGILVRRGTERSKPADFGLMVLSIVLMMVGVFLMFKVTLAFMPESIFTMGMFFAACLLLAFIFIPRRPTRRV